MALLYTSNKWVEKMKDTQDFCTQLLREILYKYYWEKLKKALSKGEIFQSWITSLQMEPQIPSVPINSPAGMFLEADKLILKLTWNAVGSEGLSCRTSVGDTETHKAAVIPGCGQTCQWQTQKAETRPRSISHTVHDKAAPQGRTGFPVNDSGSQSSEGKQMPLMSHHAQITL